MVLAITIACADNFADPDLWMHLTVGQRILRDGHIPSRNLYSYSGAGLPWHNHVWLAQVILALSYEALGVFGLRIVKLLCASTVMAALAVGMSRTAAPTRVQRVTLLGVAVGIMAQTQFRPQLFTMSMLSIVMAFLAAEVYGGRARLWPLIPIFAVWANLHGGFIVGLGALGIAAVVVGLQELWATRKITRAWSIAAVTLGCALATLLNPFGLGVWITVMHSVSDPLIRGFMADWLPLMKFIVYNWHTSKVEEIQYVVPLGLFAGFLLSLVAAPVLDDAPLAIIALFFIGAAFYTSRNIKLAVIALSLPFAHHAGLALKNHTWLRAGPRWGGASPGPVFAVSAALIVALSGGEFSNRLETWEVVPSGAVSFMKSHGLHGNILNDFGWGGYLVWHDAPRSRIFVDGRCEVVYPDALLSEYLAFLYGWSGGERLLDRYPHDFVLVKPKTGAYRLVWADPRWRIIYRDEVSALFARASAPIAGYTDEAAVVGPGRTLFP